MHFQVNGEGSALIWQTVLGTIYILICFTCSKAEERITTKTEHKETGSIMNNLWSCTQEWLALPGRGAHHLASIHYYQNFRVAWAYSHSNTHTFLPSIIGDGTDSAAIQWKQGWTSGWWASDSRGPRRQVGKPSKERQVFTHRPQINLKTSLPAHILFTNLFLFFFASVFSCFSFPDALVPNLTNYYYYL